MLLAPPFILVLAAAICAFLPSRWRAGLLLAAPAAALMSLLSYSSGEHHMLTALGFELTVVRVDELSRIFGIIFSIAALLAGVFAWHVDDRMQQVATLAYTGAAMGGVLAGDLVTLFLWWEGTALASVFLIWARRTPAAMATGMRYLIIQVTSGVLLLAGLLLHFYYTGSIAFDHLGLANTGTVLILVAFGIKCAFPLLHNWLQDAYPAATITGTVVMSALTTKMAIYALARGYAGTDVLISIGAVMALFPIVFALLEDDLRRVLAYSMNSQLGFMVVGVGIGTDLSLNGTVAHAVCSILYTGLLFMSVGAVMYRTGSARTSELGGLFRAMPLTAVCCLVGAASISAMPLLSGFVSKSMTVSAALYEGHHLVWLSLLLASAAAIAHTGIRVPYVIFFSEARDIEASEAPQHMRWAMLAAAGLCVLIGVIPASLHGLLPYDAEYKSYSLAHVLTQLQMIVFVALAYVLLVRKGLLTNRGVGVIADTDVVYRRWIPRVLPMLVSGLGTAQRAAGLRVESALGGLHRGLVRIASPDAWLAQGWRVGSMMLIVIVVMLAVLIANLF